MKMTVTVVTVIVIIKYVVGLSCNSSCSQQFSLLEEEAHVRSLLPMYLF